MSDDDPAGEDGSSEGNPFEDLEAAVGEREGDPFAGLGVGDEAPEPDDDASDVGPTDVDGATEEAPGEAETDQQDAAGDATGGTSCTSASTGDGGQVSGGGQLDTSAGGEAGPDPAEAWDFDQGGDPEPGPDEKPSEDDPFSTASPDFEEVDLGSADEDDIWEALSAARAAGSVADVREHTYAEVSKHTYCERCEHFTGPPETSCTHEGTRIVEFVDMETVRVLDCPVVAERRRLEREH